MDPLMEWLTTPEDWISYRVRRDLLGEAEDNPKVRFARDQMLADVRIQELIEELAGWPGKVIASHKSASQHFHKLTFLADLGLTRQDAGIERIIEQIMSHQSAEGPFTLPMNTDQHSGKTQGDRWAWALCDAPIVLYGLTKFGCADDPAVDLAYNYLVKLVRENGWPCAVSEELGNFRGPGRKSDPCPFANLAMLKALSIHSQYRESAAVKTGAETLLNLWENRVNAHPYIFYMGTDFSKLKSPLVWYDLLHVLDVLSNFSWLYSDPRFLNMLGVLEQKADPQGRFTSESIWTAWKDWEFGQKKTPSRWLTFLALRIIDRVRQAPGIVALA